MRSVQVLSVVAVGVGVGLLVAGYTAAPVMQVEHSGEVIWSVRLPSHQIESYLDLAIALKGFGAGLLTLGLLGLLVPWINTLTDGRHSSSAMPNNPADPA
jgi:hypothetical protein